MEKNMTGCSSNEEPLFVFSAGGKAYSLPVAEVIRVEALSEREIFPLPFGGTEGIRGLFNCHGEAVALADFPGQRASGKEERLTVVILKHRGAPVGIAVDQVFPSVCLSEWQGGPLTEAESLFTAKVC